MIEVASLAFRMLAILLIRAPMNESYEGITLLLGDWGIMPVLSFGIAR